MDDKRDTSLSIVAGLGLFRVRAEAHRRRPRHRQRLGLPRRRCPHLQCAPATKPGQRSSGSYGRATRPLRRLQHLGGRRKAGRARGMPPKFLFAEGHLDVYFCVESSTQDYRSLTGELLRRADRIVHVQGQSDHKG